MKLHMQSPHESSMCPMDFGVKRSKVKGHNARITENGFLRITASPLHLSLWNFTCSLPMSRVWTLWTLGSKGQRSRSQCKDYWKRFLAHNCFPFTPIFMKLYMQSPHESILDPMDLGSKGQRSRSQCKDYWKRFLAHNCFPYLVHNLDSLNWLPRGVFCPVRTAPF